jgi:hypothetical protein
MASRQQPGALSTRRPLVSIFAAVVGVVFLAIGVLGFIPGITTNYGDMAFAGPDSEAMLLGVFQVSVLHNIVHLLFGVAGLALAFRAFTAMLYLVVGGIIFLALWLYGLAIDHDADANFLPVNTADDWLHFGLGIGMVALGLIGWFFRPGAVRQTGGR